MKLPSSLNHSKNYGVLLNTVKYICNIKQKPLHEAYWESYKKFNCFDLQGDCVLCTAPAGLRLETAIRYFHYNNEIEEKSATGSNFSEYTKKH